MSKKKTTIMLFFLLFSIVCAYSDGPTNLTDDIIQDHERRIDLIRTNLDYVWVIISAMLVFFMQAGFMALESGMARSKNSINVAIKNLTDFVLGVIGFWVVGFGIMFGTSWNGLFGTSDFLITIEHPWTAAFFMFQAVFVGTAATIDSGAVCERAKLKPYILLSLIMSIAIYPVFGHWVWGSFLHGVDAAGRGAGWLEARGFKDFAGSSVVHSVGGWMSLAGVIIVGPRIGKFEIDAQTGRKLRPRKIPPGDMRFVFLGTFILFFGWFGFNCGSTLSATTDIASIALNTTLAACFGCLTASLASWIFHPEKKIEGDMIANGLLAGLVGITAGCAFVDTMSASVIGAISGILVFVGVNFIERVLKLDDVVGAISVHGICGAWGTLAVGLFIRPELLGGMSRGEQISIQVVGVASCFAWAFGIGIICYFLVDKFFGGVRVSKEEEILGLNIAEHGAKSSIVELATAMDNLTKSGDFTEETRVDVEYGTEIGDLAMLFNTMIDRVREALNQSREQKAVAEAMLAESEAQKLRANEAQAELETQRLQAADKRKSYIDGAKEKIGRVSDRIDGVKDLMSRTATVSRDMTDTFGNMVGGLQNMLSSLDGIHGQINEMNEITNTTTRTVRSSQDAIEKLQGVTGEIEKMVSFIDEIAARTEVLSINSSIQAAHAGESGKGFVVISKEVRELSGQTTQAVGEIGDRLSNVRSRVGQVAESMSQILNVVGEIDRLNRNVIAIVNANQQISDSMREDSDQTVKAVRSVSDDIRNVVDEAEKLSILGRTVEQDLETVE